MHERNGLSTCDTGNIGKAAQAHSILSAATMGAWPTD